MPNPTSGQTDILVCGDIVVDHHIYRGGQSTPIGHGRPGTIERTEFGGVCCTAAILKQLSPIRQEQRKQAYDKKVAEGEKASVPVPWAAGLGASLNPSMLASWPRQAWAVWSPCSLKARDGNYRGGSDAKVWRTQTLLGYGGGENAEQDLEAYRKRLAAGDRHGTPAILVLDDAGAGFRSAPNAWCLPEKPTGGSVPQWIILKMANPLVQGDLWAHLEQFADRTVTVISSSDIRRQCVSVSQGLSWELAAEQLREVLADPHLKPLCRSRHLIVTFSCDGALWLERTAADTWEATLIYDPSGAEGEFDRLFDGGALGYMSCMLAAITAGMLDVVRKPDGTLQKPDEDATRKCVYQAICAGLTAMRDLRTTGHGPAEKPGCGFPAGRLAGRIASDVGNWAKTPVPWSVDPSSRTHLWTIIEAAQRPAGATMSPSLVGLAGQVVIRGRRTLAGFPHARFGKLCTADRREIEALRTIRGLMLRHREKPSASPLCIGVFGPPGAGKSFGVGEIAHSVYGEKAWLEFNLSQFNEPEDLIGAFHQVRDRVLSEGIAVVFWDEFDSKEYQWLRYLLAPMQEGRFQQGQITHSLGHCVFIFAGATSSTFKDFGPGNTSESIQQFKLKKGPDFKSRLDAVYEVLGPNQRMLPPADGASQSPMRPDPKDACSPLRRALVIRERVSSDPDARLDFDAGLLNALLRIGKYTHGTRSLMKVVQGLKAGEGDRVRRSCLPSPVQLQMLVEDVDHFHELMGEGDDFRALVEKHNLPSRIHEFWRELSTKQGWKMKPHLDKPYEQLAPVDKEDNIAAAHRMPDVLALAGMRLTAGEASKEEEDQVRRHIEHHLEVLAEAEHDGWMDHKLSKGWHYDKVRDDANMKHNALVPYAELKQSDKAKDRDVVRHYPDMTRLAGFKIVFG